MDRDVQGAFIKGLVNRGLLDQATIHRKCLYGQDGLCCYVMVIALSTFWLMMID